MRLCSLIRRRSRLRILVGFAGFVRTGYWLTRHPQVIYANGILGEYCVLVRRHGVQLDVVFDA